jgi:hypothetical protein
VANGRSLTRIPPSVVALLGEKQPRAATARADGSEPRSAQPLLVRGIEVAAAAAERLGEAT